MAPEYVKGSRYNNNFNYYAFGVDEFNNVGPARTRPQRQLSFCCALVLVFITLTAFTYTAGRSAGV